MAENADTLRALALQQQTKSQQTQVTEADIVIGLSEFVNGKDETKQHFSRELWHNDNSLSAHAKKIRQLIEGNEELNGKVLVGYSKGSGVFLVKTTKKAEEKKEETVESGVKVEA